MSWANTKKITIKPRAGILKAKSARLSTANLGPIISSKLTIPRTRPTSRWIGRPLSNSIGNRLWVFFWSKIEIVKKLRNCSDSNDCA